MFHIRHNNRQEIIEIPILLSCPHCSSGTNLIPVSLPDFHQLMKFQPENIGIGYICAICRDTIFLRFTVHEYNKGTGLISVETEFRSVEFAIEKFELNYLPKEVRCDFEEALKCYSFKAYNGFGAMSRRTIQSTATHLGAKGKNKVKEQVQDMIQLVKIDEDTSRIINQVILDGHDGAHPHLPELNSERARILLELLKDVMYQIYVRTGKLKEASEKRKEQIKMEKENRNE